MLTFSGGFFKQKPNTTVQTSLPDDTIGDIVEFSDPLARWKLRLLNKQWKQYVDSKILTPDLFFISKNPHIKYDLNAFIQEKKAIFTSNPTKEIKILFVGNSPLKSDVYNSIKVQNKLNSTLGIALKFVKSQSDQRHKLFQIWDTPGQESFQKIIPLYYKHTDLIVLFINNSEDLNKYLTQISNDAPNIPIICMVQKYKDLQHSTLNTKYPKICEVAEKNNLTVLTVTDNSKPQEIGFAFMQKINEALSLSLDQKPDSVVRFGKQ